MYVCEPVYDVRDRCLLDVVPKVPHQSAWGQSLTRQSWPPWPGRPCGARWGQPASARCGSWSRHRRPPAWRHWGWGCRGSPWGQTQVPMASLLRPSKECLGPPQPRCQGVKLTFYPCRGKFYGSNSDIVFLGHLWFHSWNISACWWSLMTWHRTEILWLCENCKWPKHQLQYWGNYSWKLCFLEGEFLNVSWVALGLSIYQV